MSSGAPASSVVTNECVVLESVITARNHAVNPTRPGASDKRLLRPKTKFLKYEMPGRGAVANGAVASTPKCFCGEPLQG